MVMTYRCFWTRFYFPKYAFPFHSHPETILLLRREAHFDSGKVRVVYLDDQVIDNSHTFEFICHIFNLLWNLILTLIERFYVADKLLHFVDKGEPNASSLTLPRENRKLL